VGVWRLLQSATYLVADLDWVVRLWEVVKFLVAPDEMSQ
jgi:hypothetical protein